MKIRTRLNLAIGGLVCIAVLAFAYIMASEIRPRYSEAQEDVMIDFAETMATLVGETSVSTHPVTGQPVIDTQALQAAFAALSTRSINARIYQFEKIQTDTRVYLTDRTGTVIFDSDNSRDVGINYLHWRDVSRALRGVYGARTTQNDPLYTDGATMYVASPIRYLDKIVGAISVGKPTKNIDSFVLNVANNLWLTGFAVAISFALISYLIYRSLTKPLTSIQRYALDISQGRPSKRPDVGDNEIGDVEIALQAMRHSLDGKQYIEAYVQSLTHELKAPIAGITGAAELLQEDLPSNKKALFLNNIRSQAARMHDLIDRLLTLAKVENTDALTLYETVDLSRMLEDVRTAFSEVAQRKSLTIKQVGPEAKINGDYFLLYQAISNLIKNAVEHATPNTEVSVGCIANGSTLTISVTNVGAAVPSYALDKAFDRFFSLPTPTGQKGSGIGLNFVKEVAKLHGGSATLKNQPEGCVTGSIYVPVNT